MLRIVTDSTCDLTDEQAKQYGIDAVAKLYVIFGKQSFQDGVTITKEQFYGLLKSNPNFPTTSQPSVGDFVSIYERFKGDQIVSVHISRDLSGTIASAEAARDLVGGDITIVDSRNVNAGLALLVLEAIEQARKGATPAQIKAHVESLAPRTHLNFALETLENLRRGGRIGGAQALLGSVLQFKPIITIKEGRVEPLERVRTMSKVVARLKEIAMQDLNGRKGMRVAFMHTAARGSADELSRSFCAENDVNESLMVEAGPVVATHAGPGAVGIAYIA
jgi:DegV family protein with EDD domain